MAAIMEKEKEKQSSKLKNKFSKITAAISVTFQNPPFSPSRVVNKSHHGSSRGFSSSPLVPKVGGDETQQDPTSPTISCMGQIKHKKMQMKKSRSLSVALSSHMSSDDNANSSSSSPRLVKNSKQSASSRFQRMLMFKPPKPEKSGSVGGGGGSAAVGDEGSGKIIGPPLGEMRRFASGRESFASFDWKAQVAPDEIEQQRDCYTDEKRRDTVNTFSGPILGGFQANLQQRKEINLWKRRTTAQPRPLQLKPVLTAR